MLNIQEINYSWEVGNYLFHQTIEWIYADESIEQQSQFMR